MNTKRRFHLQLLAAAWGVGLAAVGVAAWAQTGKATPQTGARRVVSAAPPIAFVRGGGVWVADANGKNARLLVANASCPTWSPDGKRIAWARDGNVFVSDAQGKNVRQASVWPPPKPATATGGDENEDDGRRAIGGISWGARDNVLTFARDDRYRLTHEDVGPTNIIGGSGSVVISALFEVPIPGANAKPATARTLHDWGAGKTGFMFSHYDSPAWSPSGNYLAFVVNGDIWISVRGERKRDENDKPLVPTQWEWDTRRLAAVAVYDAPNYRGSRANRGVTSLSWSPGSDVKLLYGLQRLDGSGLAEARLLTMKNGFVVRDTPVPIREPNSKALSDDVYSPRFSRDGKSIEYSRFGTVRAARLDGTGDRLLLPNADL